MKNNNPISIPMFKVFKQGTTTNGPITILKKEGEPFNEAKKRAWYIYLGYTVTEL